MRMTPAVKVILMLNVVVYGLTDWIMPRFALGGDAEWFTRLGALMPVGYGFSPHQYLTYMFMHGGWWHLFFNMWSLMIFGNAVEQQLGTRRFVSYYLLCGVGSAMVNQLCVMSGIIPPAPMVGASGAIYGVMAAAAYFFPNAKLFIIPIPFPIKLKYLVGFYTLAEMYYGITSVDSVAHFAHLGGILVGILVLLVWRWQLLHRNARNNSRWSSSATFQTDYDRGPSAWDKVKKPFAARRQPTMRVTEVREAGAPRPAEPVRKMENSEEIDRILEKIRKNGYQNLTTDEKAILFDASKHIRKD